MEEFGPLEVKVYGNTYKFPKGIIKHEGKWTYLLNLDETPYDHPLTYFDGVLDYSHQSIYDAIHCKESERPVRTPKQLEKYRVMPKFNT